MIRRQNSYGRLRNSVGYGDSETARKCGGSSSSNHKGNNAHWGSGDSVAASPQQEKPIFGYGNMGYSVLGGDSSPKRRRSKSPFQRRNSATKYSLLAAGMVASQKEDCHKDSPKVPTRTLSMPMEKPNGDKQQDPRKNRRSRSKVRYRPRSKSRENRSGQSCHTVTTADCSSLGDSLFSNESLCKAIQKQNQEIDAKHREDQKRKKKQQQQPSGELIDLFREKSEKAKGKTKRRGHSKDSKASKKDLRKKDLRKELRDELLGDKASKKNAHKEISGDKKAVRKERKVQKDSSLKRQSSLHEEILQHSPTNERHNLFSAKTRILRKQGSGRLRRRGSKKNMKSLTNEEEDTRDMSNEIPWAPEPPRRTRSMKVAERQFRDDSPPRTPRRSRSKIELPTTPKRSRSKKYAASTEDNSNDGAPTTPRRSRSMKYGAPNEESNVNKKTPLRSRSMLPVEGKTALQRTSSGNLRSRKPTRVMLTPKASPHAFKGTISSPAFPSPDASKLEAANWSSGAVRTPTNLIRRSRRTAEFESPEENKFKTEVWQGVRKTPKRHGRNYSKTPVEFPSPNPTKISAGAWMNSKRTPKTSIALLKKHHSPNGPPTESTQSSTDPYSTSSEFPFGAPLVASHGKMTQRKQHRGFDVVF